MTPDWLPDENEDFYSWDVDNGLELEVEYDYDVSSTGFEDDD